MSLRIRISSKLDLWLFAIKFTQKPKPKMNYLAIFQFRDNSIKKTDRNFSEVFLYIDFQ